MADAHPAQTVENPENRIRDGEHIFAVRVYYEDTDAGGIVYYANYLRYAERARTEMIRDLGIRNPDLHARHGAAFAVRRCNADYRRPARLDDLLAVHTRLTAVGGASLDAVQSVRRDGEELVHLDVRLAYMTADGRAARLPKDVRGVLAELCGGSASDRRTPGLETE
jgi:acyl-CoA thioester hydrolase